MCRRSWEASPWRLTQLCGHWGSGADTLQLQQALSSQASSAPSFCTEADIPLIFLALFSPGGTGFTARLTPVVQSWCTAVQMTRDGAQQRVLDPSSTPTLPLKVLLPCGLHHKKSPPWEGAADIHRDEERGSCGLTLTEGPQRAWKVLRALSVLCTEITPLPYHG